MRRPTPDVLDPKIHHNNLLGSILAKIEANAAGADDAIMLDHRGFIAETNATHVFFVSKDRLCTSTTAACPEGVTRSTILRLADDAGLETVVGDFSLPELYAATEAFVTGTMGEVAAVTTVDGRPIGTDPPGPVTRRLSEAFAALTAKAGTRVVG